jgi:hypothetical protein
MKDCSFLKKPHAYSPTNHDNYASQALLNPDDPLDTERIQLSSIHEIKHHLCPDQRRKQVNSNSQAQGHRKPLDGSGSK